MTPFRSPVRLLAKLVRLNLDAFVAHRERRRYLEADPARWSRLDRDVFAEQRPVFILSTGRCGTKLLADLFEKVPRTLCFHAPKPELIAYEKQAYEHGRAEFEAYRLLVGACRFELMADAVVRERRYIETNQRITFFAPHLHDLFPGACFVHLVRHPHSFIRSGVARGYYEGRYSDLGRITPLNGPAAERWPRMSNHEKCAWLWNETNGFIERFKAECPDAGVLTVQSEDLFRDPGAMQEILQHCHLPDLPASTIRRVLARRPNANPHRKKSGGADGNGADWKAEVRPWLGNACLYGHEI